MDAMLLPSPTPVSRLDTVGMRMSLITDVAGLEALRPEWERLLAASAHAEPMLDPIGC